MKYVLSLLLGLLLGAAAAAGLVYLNPLTQRQAEGTGGGPAFDYVLSRSGALLSTHDGVFGLPVVPAEAPRLWESGLKGSLLAVLPLEGRAAAGRGVATRISVPSPSSELLRAGVLVDDYWLVSVSGSGTLFVHASSNLWPLLRDTLVGVDWLRRDWAEPKVYRPTRGPADGAADVVGLTGRYAGTRGRAAERLTVASYRGSLDELEGELVLDLAASPQSP